MEYIQLEKYLKAVGEGTRLKILKYITNGPQCICDLTAALGMSQPAVSQHMRRLKDEDIVKVDKLGKWTYWSLNAAHVQYPILIELLNLLPAEELTKQCCSIETEEV